MMPSPTPSQSHCSVPIVCVHRQLREHKQQIESLQKSPRKTGSQAETTVEEAVQNKVGNYGIFNSFTLGSTVVSDIQWIPALTQPRK